MSKTKIEAEINSLVKRSGMHAYQINCGLCEDFAEMIAAVVPGAEVVGFEIDMRPGEDIVDVEDRIGLPGHVWIRYRGRFYDSEAPRGVSDWKKLPLFIRTKEEHLAIRASIGFPPGESPPEPKW